MTDAQKLDAVIFEATREHLYPKSGRTVIRETTTDCGYIIITTVTTDGIEQMDIDRAHAALDEKESVYLSKLIKWGKIA
jgi:hypothetical protein